MDDEKEEIGRLRSEIDRLDDAILGLLNERAQVVKKAGVVKRTKHYRPEREAQIIRRLSAANSGPLSSDDIRGIYRTIISSCMALEKQFLLAYLGPAGTFSEIALRRQFGDKPETVPCNSIAEVFRVVQTGECDFGVVPVENSSEGSVGATLDLLLTSPLFVCGEIILPVNFNLLSHCTSFEKVRRVYGHNQALAQCHGWLKRYLLQAEQHQVLSNAEGARLASKEKDAAALASAEAAALYQIPALARNIEDRPDNSTRFFVVGRQHINPSGLDKTSLVCSAINRPGSMVQLLKPLAQHGVTMTKLESRPSGQVQWDYVFYIDVVGHQEDESVAQALASMREHSTFLKVLGSYPQAFA